MRSESSHKPKISVIMPVYNTQKYLDESLDGVLGQTLNDIEVICIDDGSIDMSMQILANRMEFDDRIIVLSQTNQGAGPARNRGMRIASGEYIAFLDSDDMYPSLNTLECLYSTAVKTESLICGGSCIIYNMEIGNYEMSDKLTFDSEGFHTFAEDQNDYGFYTCIYKTNFLKENNIIFPPLRRYQDPPFFAEAMLAAKKYYIIPDPVYTYRFVKKGVGGSWSEEQVLDLIRGVMYNIKLAYNNGLEKLYYDSIMRLEKNYCRHTVENSIGKIAIRNELMRVQSSIDTSILRKIDPTIPNTFILQPLVDYIAINNAPMIKTQRELTQLRINLSKAQGALESIESSISFKLGRILTSPGRTLRDLIKRP